MIVACSVVFAWARYRLDSYRKQHEAFASISQHARHVGARPGSPSWLRPFAEVNTFSDIGHLSFQGARKFSNGDLKQLSHLPKLHRLSLHGTGITDEGMSHLSN